MRIEEYIICAAIWYADTKEYPHQPRNVASGYVICGHRHHNCITTNYILTGESTGDNAIQGFLTSHNKFVDRKDANTIALNQNQILNVNLSHTANGPELYSEDIY